MMMSRRDHGLTLIELTVGVAVMTGIIASAYFCLHAGFTSQRALDEHMDQTQKARVVLAMMTKDLRHACAWNQDFTFVGMDRKLGNIEADNVDFATHNWRPRAPGEGDICEISYFVDKNRETGEVGLWRRRDASPDYEPLAGGDKEELVTGVLSLRFEYYDGLWWYDSWGRVDPRREPPSEQARSSVQAESSEQGGESLTSFAGNLYGLPDAVRISIAFGEETRPEEGPGRLKDGRAEESSIPLLFQTVVYLNLADRASRSSMSSFDSSETASGNSGEGGNRAR